MSAFGGGREMLCAVCEIPLDAEDNYCRNCGEAVQIAPLPVVRGVSGSPAVIRAVAAPIASGAVLIAVTAVARWALGQALRGLIAGSTPRRQRELSGRSPAPAPGLNETVEFLWYRRTRGG